MSDYQVGFVGIGNMGWPMAKNLLKAEHEVTGFDLNAEATERLAANGGNTVNSHADACKAVEVVITMLPAGEQVRDVYLGAGGVLATVAPGTLLIDSSTIDVQTARDVAQAAQEKGLAIVDLSNEAEEMASEATWAAMKSGAQAIVQASLGSGDWRGRADVLLRVEQIKRPGRFGNWSYEVVDCKLARETKAETILQLCLYSELVTELQGLEPEFFHVIRPNVGFQSESYRLSAFGAYYRLVKRALQDAAKAGSSQTYPEPVSHCDICRWWKECDSQWRHDDHLSFVAGASKLQRKELTLQGVPSLESLAKLPLPIPFNPSRGARVGKDRVMLKILHEVNQALTEQARRLGVGHFHGDF